MGVPVFSVIIPMKNGSEFISETLNSLLSQSFSDWEAIVVDDCSTDGGKSIGIVIDFQKRTSKISLVELKTGKGSSGARNEALKRVKGRYIAFLDADDIWHSDYLQTMYNHIQNSKIENAAIYYCGYRRMNEGCTEAILQDYKAPGIKTYKKLLYHCPMFPSITIVDTHKLKSPVCFREELKSLRDDYVYLLDILKQGLVGVGFEDVLVDYRMRANSLTASKTKMIKPQWRVYREVLKMNFFQSLFYELLWGLNGVKKYWLSKVNKKRQHRQTV